MTIKDLIGGLWKKRATPDNDTEMAISHFQSQTAEISDAPDPTWARGAVLLFAVLVIGAIALAAILRVERVVVARGMVVSETPTIVVQPLERAVVDSIEVRPGELVRQGQILARLDPTISDADVSALERRLASFDAEIGRLEAEIADKPYTPKEPGEFSDLQVAVHRHRTAEFQASMANYDQQIAATTSELARSTLESDIYGKRYVLLGEIVDMRAKLEKTAAGSRLTSIQSEDDRLSIERSLAESNGLAQTARHRIEALHSERDTFREKWRADAINRLVALRQDYSGAKEELAKATYRRSLVALRSVSDAVVLDVAPVSVGSVLEAARELLRLVPLNAELELEVDISGADQGFVAVGDEVQIKFDAYAFGEHGTGRGEVRTISQDSFTRPDGPRAGEVYYRARVAILATDLRDVPADFRIIPGMPVTADIVVGDHSILSSLTGGLADSFSTGLREP